MGSWNSDLYSNDMAQDFLCNMKKLLNNNTWLNEYIRNLKKINLYEDRESDYSAHFKVAGSCLIRLQ